MSLYSSILYSNSVLSVGNYLSVAAVTPSSAPLIPSFPILPLGFIVFLIQDDPVLYAQFRDVDFPLVVK